MIAETEPKAASVELIHPYDALQARITADTSTQSSMCDRQQSAIAAQIPGWSRISHWVFFRSLLDVTPMRRLLVCGVYHGRDIAYLLQLRTRHYPERPLRIIGVDLFRNGDCADWPAGMKNRKLSWMDAGFGPPPSIDAAIASLSEYARNGEVSLTQDDDEHFLANCKEVFDTIYLDASHDYASVARQLRQVRKLCQSGETIICGDDFRDGGTWGVEKAVREAFGSIHVVGDQIWFTDAAHFKDQSLPSNRS